MKADGYDQTYTNMQKAAGAFGFVASLLGYYCTAHYLCEDALGFELPVGDLSAKSLWKKSNSLKDCEA